MEKKAWIYYVTTDRPWHAQPNYKAWGLMDGGSPMTEREANEWLWDARENIAPDVRFEECSQCQGEPGNLHCGDCGGDGGWDGDWEENVERNTYAGLEAYDPKYHYKVPSQLPEHRLWKSNEARNRAREDSKAKLQRVESLRNQLEEARIASSISVKDYRKACEDDISLCQELSVDEKTRKPL